MCESLNEALGGNMPKAGKNSSSFLCVSFQINDARCFIFYLVVPVERINLTLVRNYFYDATPIKSKRRNQLWFPRNTVFRYTPLLQRARQLPSENFLSLSNERTEIFAYL